MSDNARISLALGVVAAGLLAILSLAVAVELPNFGTICLAIVGQLLFWMIMAYSLAALREHIWGTSDNSSA